MNDIKGIIEDVEKSSLVSNKVIKKVIEIIGQEKWQDIHDEESDICTTAGELSITLRDIVYIEKEPENKRCIIKTINQDYYIQGTLNKIQTLLDNRFFKCNKSYIINKEQMRSYDKKTNIIKFRNGLEITSLARAKKRELINYLRCIN